jgi:hypothetical protein
MPHEAAVTSTKATKHYGVSANAVYNEAEDAGQPKLWDPYESCYRVRKITWYIYYVRPHPKILLITKLNDSMAG